MNSTWVDIYLGPIYQIYGLAFFVLGIVVLMTMGNRYLRKTGLSAHLGWLAAFGILHGLQEFVEGERIRNSADLLAMFALTLMVTSFATLLEFGRRLWNERLTRWRLDALPFYFITVSIMLMLTMAVSEIAAGLEFGARYLLGMPGGVLAGVGLLGQAGMIAYGPDTKHLIYRLRLAAFAMLGYAFLTLLVSAESGRAVAGWLPTTQDFLELTGIPVQMVRALCAGLLALAFIAINRISVNLTTSILGRVTDNLEGFVYRCRNDSHWTVTFMSDGGETLTGYPTISFLRGERYFVDQIHPDDQSRVWSEVQAALAARRNYRLQYRLLDCDGAMHWCYEEGRGVVDKQGELLYLEGLVRNDDARHKAEEDQWRMQALVEASPEAMGWADPDGTVRYFNVALRRLLAVPEGADISDYCLQDFYDDKAYEQIQSVVQSAVAAKDSWTGEIELKALSGRTVPTLHNVFILQDEVGGMAAIANVITDLSDIREAELDLKIKDTAIASSTSAIALAGLNGELTYVNQAFVELWGLAGPEEAIGRSALSFWEDPNQAQSVVDIMVHSGRWQGELPGRRSDGSLVDVQLTGHMVLDNEGQPICMMASFLDVTASNQAQQALQHERDFARSLLDTAPVIILLLDPSGMVRHVNRYFEQLTGYRSDEIVGKDWFATCLPARDQAPIRELFTTAIYDQPVRGNINPIVTRDGDECNIEWHAKPLRDVSGQMTGLLSIGMDVTERQKLEKQLREINESLEQRVLHRTEAVERELQRNAAILDTTVDGFFCADVSGRIRQVNPAFCAMLGYDKSELLSMSITDIEAEESPEETAAHIEKVLSLGYDRFDTRHCCKDGRILEVEIGVSLVTLGNETLFYAFTRDIGPRKAIEARLTQASDEAKRANAAKSDFLSRMSHELRTPLNAILGFSEILLMPDELPLSAQQSDSVREIKFAGEHLLTLVNEVLDLARIEAGYLEVRSESVALCPVIEHCVAQIVPAALERGIHPQLQLNEPYTVRGDPTRLKQVLLNLLSNAVKYNREWGDIVVACMSTDGERVRISVRDTGRGLSEEQQERLFRPFERLESAYEGIDGTGIGLALAKQLVEGMQGRIGVDSLPGQGSTFWFELPLCNASEVDDTVLISTPVNTVGERHTVLYIEDNPSNLRLVQKILKKRTDIELLSAMNAEEGLALARREPPDLILVDINLPGMSGYQLLEIMKAEAGLRHIPVMAITANAMPRDIARGKAAGFQGYLTKPLKIDDFYAAIEPLLASQKGIT